VTRTAADISAGLAPARAARAIRPGERIHVIGVAGAGASAAALHAAAHGAIASGCDSGGPSPYTPALEAGGIELAWHHDPSHVTGPNPPDRLAVSKSLTAVDPEHAELAAAHAAGIETEAWQQVIADAAIGRTLVAIAGTHGKSTTAGWLTHVLITAGRDPSAFVGALLPSSITGGAPATTRQGSGDLFVVEADEYAGNWDAYVPDLAVITNIDWDHPDVFADRAAVVEAFVAWLEAAPKAMLAINVGDPGNAELLHRLERRGDLEGRAVGRVVVGADDGGHGADLLATVTEAGQRSTLVRFQGARLGEITVPLRTAGQHNVANAAVVVAAAARLGIPADKIADGLATFSGVGRRLERKGEAGGVVVYDDYGHHPTAITATLAAVRQLEPGRRVWIACEPLTFHRTAALLELLAAALVDADGVAVAAIWPNRDPDLTITSSGALADAIARLDPGKPVAAPGDVEATADWLLGQVEPGEVVLVMGGGHSYQIADRLLDGLAGR
jgi:UDP-N-acetylmuramate--alanine ligase